MFIIYFDENCKIQINIQVLFIYACSSRQFWVDAVSRWFVASGRGFNTSELMCFTAFSYLNYPHWSYWICSQVSWDKKSNFPGNAHPILCMQKIRADWGKLTKNLKYQAFSFFTQFCWTLQSHFQFIFIDLIQIVKIPQTMDNILAFMQHHEFLGWMPYDAKQFILHYSWN